MEESRTRTGESRTRTGESRTRAEENLEKNLESVCAGKPVSEAMIYQLIADLAAMDEIFDKIIGMIFGHALGDAVGLITEFSSKKEAPVIVFPYIQSIRNYPICDWTDDTDNLIIVMQSMIANDFHFNPKDLAERMKTWATCGFPELGDKQGAGLNGIVGIIVNHPSFITAPVAAAAEIWTNSKKTFTHNGSMTRTSIVGALFHAADPLGWAYKLSRMTHIDNRCTLSCMLQSHIIYCLIYQHARLTSAPCIDFMLAAVVRSVREYAHDFAAGEQSSDAQSCDAQSCDHPTQEKGSSVAKGSLTAPAAYEDILAADLALADAEMSKWVETAYTQSIDQLHLDAIANMSHAFKCLGCSIYTLQVIKTSMLHGTKPSFKKCVVKIAQECGDADANAAVAGATLGAYLGYLRLPADWIKSMPNSVWLANIVFQFVMQLCEVRENIHRDTESTERSVQPRKTPNDPGLGPGPLEDDAILKRTHQRTREDDPAGCTGRAVGGNADEVNGTVNTAVNTDVNTMVNDAAKTTIEAMNTVVNTTVNVTADLSSGPG